MTVFIALDPAHSSGFALAKVTGSHCDIFEYGYIDVDTSSPYIGDWCLDLQSRIEAIHSKHMFSDIGVEAFFFSSRFASGSEVSPAYRTAIHMWARQKGMPYSILNIGSWKTIAAGRSSPTKEQKLKWGKTDSKKLYLVQALWERHGIRLPNHSISEKTGKPVIFRYDIADAIGMTIYHAYEKYNCKTFSCSVVVPPDVTFLKASKKHFQYPDPRINDLGNNATTKGDGFVTAEAKESRPRKSRVRAI